MAAFSSVLVAVLAAFRMAAAQTVSGPGGETGTNYFWPRYNYTNTDLKYLSKMTLSSPYVCKWDVTVSGINMNQGVLILPPCTYITPHWHPTTYELNFILEGNLTYWIFTYGEPGKVVPPQQGFVPQGNALVSPLGLMHLLFNNECDILTMMHSFPTSTNEDFFSSWAFVKGMPDAYLNNVVAPDGSNMKSSLNIPDGVHTLSQECMARCGVTQAYYDNFHCPADLPFEPHIIKRFMPSGSPSLFAKDATTSSANADKERIAKLEARLEKLEKALNATKK